MKCKKCKKSTKCSVGGAIFKVFLKIFGVLFGVFAVLFSIFFFDLDGKLMFYVVEPFLKKHYDNMDRKDTLKKDYDINKYPKYDYESVYKKGE